MEAIILAGGFGTRLAHIVSDLPKPMAPVCERPFLRFILDDIIEKGVTKIILAVGYKQESIMDYFKSTYRGAQILYSPENTPLGTGGAIQQALKLCTKERVFVFNGDTFFDVDLKKMAEQTGEIVVATKRMYDFSRYGTVQVAKNRITAFQEKEPTKCGLINGGIYYLNRQLPMQVESENFSFETEVLEKMVANNGLISFESEGYFIDIGVPEDYEKAQKDMQEKCKKNKLAFFDRDGTINVNTGHLYKIEEMEFIQGMPQFIKKWNDFGFKVVVVTNQAGIAKGYYTEKDMHLLNNYMNEQLAKYDAHIDAFYFCPHHPDFTGECACRKPKAGMLEKAIFEFDADVSQSILFGDKMGDIHAAKACGVLGVLV